MLPAPFGPGEGLIDRTSAQAQERRTKGRLILEPVGDVLGAEEVGNDQHQQAYRYGGPVVSAQISGLRAASREFPVRRRATASNEWKTLGRPPATETRDQVRETDLLSG